MVRPVTHTLLRSLSSRCVDGLPETMRAVHIRTVGSNGGPEALEMLTNLPLPWTELTPTSVLVRVRAAGVNRPDVLQRRGLYPPPPGHSPLPGLEVSGTIVAAGAAVQLSGGGNGGESLDLALGDEVCALTNGGGYAEYCAVDVGACLRLPTSSSFCAVKAACVPETFCTVWHNVYRQCNAFNESLLDRPSPSLLVHGGSSGIGTAAIAMGTALGVDVYATAGSDAKVEACLKLGAKDAFNYHDTARWDEALREVRGGDGVDLVLDMVGPSYLSRNLAALKEGGRVAMIGMQGGHTFPAVGEGERAVSLAALLSRRLSVGGATLRPLPTAAKTAIVSELRDQLWTRAAVDGEVPVVIDSTFDLEHASDAHRR